MGKEGGCDVDKMELQYKGLVSKQALPRDFSIFQMVLLWTVLFSKWDVSALLYIYRVHIHKHSVKALKQLFTAITNALVKYKTFYFGF